MLIEPSCVALGVSEAAPTSSQVQKHMIICDPPKSVALGHETPTTKQIHVVLVCVYTYQRNTKAPKFAEELWSALPY